MIRNLFLLFTILLIATSCDKSTNSDTPQPIKVSELITRDTFFARGNHYIIEGQVQIIGATLTIEPGVKIQFKPYSSILVKNSGAIRATGTPSDSITLTYLDSDRRNWSGIILENSNASTFEYTVFGYGMVNMVQSQAGFRNCTFRNPDDYAVKLDQSSYFSYFYDNQIYDSKQFDMLIFANHASSIGPNNQFNQNIAVKGPYTIADGTWLAHNVAYELFEGLTIGNNPTSTLRLAPGAKIAVHGCLQIGNKSMQHSGKLLAIGTETQPVIFTSNAGSSNWDGLKFEHSNSISSQFSYCTFDKTDNWMVFDYETTQAGVIVNHCKVTNSFSGIDGRFSNINWNSFTHNQIEICNDFIPGPQQLAKNAAICIESERLSELDPTNDFTGSYIKIDFKNGIPTGKNVIMHRFAIPYYLHFLQNTTETILYINGTLTIQPGVVLHTYGGIEVRNSGRLVADGTTEAIRFEIPGIMDNVDYLPYYWNGLKIANGSVLKNCNINGAGSIQFEGDYIAAVHADASCTISNCRIKNSRSWGIYGIGVLEAQKNEWSTTNEFAYNYCGDVTILATSCSGAGK